MKRILIISALLIFTLNIYSQQSGWVWQNPLSLGNSLFNIKLFNSGTGYCQSGFDILKTTNMGADWRIIHNNERITGMFFINELTGYYGTSENIFLSRVYRTTDGGKLWQQVSSLEGISIYKMFWLGNNGILIAIDNNNGPRKVIRTSNGGNSWSTIFSNPSINIQELQMINDSTYCIGSHGPYVKAIFLKTTNHGVSWDSVNIRSIIGISSIKFLNELTGYISGQSVIGTGPCVFRTTTGGLTWDSIFYSGNGVILFQKFEFINTSNGYALSLGKLFKTSDSGFSWTQLNTNPQVSFHIDDFSVTDQQNIIVCFYKGGLGKSNNGGINWASNSSGYYGMLRAIRFFDENTGIAAGGDLNHRAMILRTTNSGSHWDTLSLDYGQNAFLNGITKVNENTAFISGYGKIYKTTDKGESFTTLSTYSEKKWEEVSFPSLNTGYAISEHGTIDKTTDGGQSWTNIRMFANSLHYTICFINDNTGFIGGNTLLKTINGGSNWDTVYTNIQGGHNTVKAAYINNTIYLLGRRYGNSNNTSLVIKSTDLGAAWTADSLQNEDYSYDISIPSPEVMYVIGANYIHKSVNGSPWKLYKTHTSHNWKSGVSFINNTTGFISTSEGGILKTITGGEPIAVEPPIEVPTNFYLYQNYPNPFNPITTIRYGLPKNLSVKIKIFDILGRLVTQLVNENQSAGNYSINFDGSNFASGVYFYTIETPDFIHSKKMVLLK